MKKFDKDLIFFQSEDARAKIKDMARLLGKSSQRIKYNLAHLEKEGVISDPFCIFDYSHFGLLMFKVYFKGGYIGEREKETIIQKLRENEYVVSVYEMSGGFDLVIEIESPNPSRFNKVLKKICSSIPTLTNYIVIVNVATFFYPRIYLTSRNDLHSLFRQKVVIGGDQELHSFDKNEMAVMYVLLANPKARYTVLAREARINVKTVQQILHKLNEKKTIEGFKHVIDTNKLEINRFRLFLRLHNMTKEKEEDVMDYMLKTKEVIMVSKTIGEWNMEIDIEAFHKSRTRKLIIEIRERFKDLIENFNMIEFYQYYKRSYLPGYLFQKDDTTLLI